MVLKKYQVPGTVPSGKPPKSEPYRTVPCRTMQWKSAISLVILCCIVSCLLSVYLGLSLCLLFQTLFTPRLDYLLCTWIISLPCPANGYACLLSRRIRNNMLENNNFLQILTWCQCFCPVHFLVLCEILSSLTFLLSFCVCVLLWCKE